MGRYQPIGGKHEGINYAEEPPRDTYSGDNVVLARTRGRDIVRINRWISSAHDRIGV